MRDIKFRVRDGKKMISWDVLKNLKTILLSKILEHSHLSYKPMQYTGIKDKNSVEIYEGDIIEYDSRNYTYTVGFDDVRGMRMKTPINQKLGNYEPLCTIATREGKFSVIGNIYQNPELLQ